MGRLVAMICIGLALSPLGCSGTRACRRCCQPCCPPVSSSYEVATEAAPTWNTPQTQPDVVDEDDTPRAPAPPNPLPVLH